MGYRAELDGVRGVAVVLVIWHHLGVLQAPRIAGGFMGVDVFFVLSGFLITTLLLQEREHTTTIDLPAFYARRALRLLPALGLMLVVAAIAVYVSGLDAEVAKFNGALPWVVLYAGNWKTGALGILTHTWSLAIEEQFYLLWPPILLLALRRHIDRRVVTGALIGGVVVLAFIGAAWGTVPAKPISHTGDVIVQTYTRAAGILLGCLIAIRPDVARHARETIVGAAATAGAVIVLLLRRDPSTFHFRIGYLAFVVFVAVALAHVVYAPDGPMAKALRFDPLVRTGRISYGLYLFHVPVILFLAWEETVPLGIGAALVAIVVTVALALWSWFIVERPALRLQERFRRRPAPVVRDPSG